MRPCGLPVGDTGPTLRGRTRSVLVSTDSLAASSVNTREPKFHPTRGAGSRQNAVLAPGVG